MSAESFPELLDAWSEGVRYETLFGLRIAVRTVGPVDAPYLLILHGFPTFSFDFRRVLPALARRFRVVLHDHPGFGLSDKPAPATYSYSLIDQAEVAAELWRRLDVKRGHLLAHDYGTSVATELLARRERGLLPLEIDSVTLSNGSIHLELARLTLAQRILRRPRMGLWFARLVGRRFFGRRIRAVLGRPDAISEAELDALWAGLTRAEGRRRMPALSSYLGDRTRFEARFIPPLTRLDRPAHLLWGRRDPVAVPAIAERLAQEIPGARLTWLEGLGHYPMLEEPELYSSRVTRFLADL